MRDKKLIESKLAKVQYEDRFGVQINDRCHLDIRAKTAIDLASKIALLSEADGEDSAGRAKGKLLNPYQVAERSVEITKYLFDEIDKNNWVDISPTINEIDEKSEKIKNQ